MCLSIAKYTADTLFESLEELKERSAVAQFFKLLNREKLLYSRMDYRSFENQYIQ